MRLLWFEDGEKTLIAYCFVERALQNISDAFCLSQIFKTVKKSNMSSCATSDQADGQVLISVFQSFNTSLSYVIFHYVAESTD